MSKKINNLFVVTNIEEATQALEFFTRNDKIISLALETDTFLKSKLSHYENSLYKYLNKKSSISQYKHVFLNFKIAHNWYRGNDFKLEYSEDFLINNFYHYIKDRFGYYLSEFDRSLDFVQKILSTVKPGTIYTSDLHDYSGSLIIRSSLKNDAIRIFGKLKGIPVKTLKNKKGEINLRQSLGLSIKYLRQLIKQNLSGTPDVLVLAPARHLIQMSKLLNNLELANLNIKLFTYNLTYQNKRLLDQKKITYFEKERFWSNKLNSKVKRLKKSILTKRRWEEFCHPKYKNSSIINKYMKSKLEKIIQDEGDEIIKDYLLAESILSGIKPKVLITTTDPDPKLLPFIEYANQIGSKTVCLQHGFFFLRDFPVIVPESEIFITWSKLSNNFISKYPDFKYKKVLIGQSPFHDFIPFMPKRLKKNKKYKMLILTCTDTFDIHFQYYFYKKLLIAFKKSELNYLFNLRPYPNQEIGGLLSLAREMDLNVKIDTNKELKESLKESDIILFENTTAGLDAMLNGKPTIYFNPYTGVDFFGVNRTKAALTVLNEKEINNKLVPFLQNQNLWERYSRKGYLFAKNYLGLNNFKVDKNVEIIKNLLS